MSLIEESQDRHSDVTRHSDALLPDLADAAADARSVEIDPADVARFDEDRRRQRALGKLTPVEYELAFTTRQAA